MIKRMSWTGTDLTILPETTVDENEVITAGAMINKDVTPNKVVSGIPVKVIKMIKRVAWST